MAVLIGQADNRLIGGVLGTVNTDDATLNGASAGIVGLAGTSAAVDDWNGNVESDGQPTVAAVLGAVPVVSDNGRPASSCLGFLAGTDSVTQQQTGVYGQGPTGVVGQSWAGNAVLGLGHNSASAAVSAVNDSGGLGLWAESRGGSGPAGHFQGAVQIEGSVAISGSLVVEGQDLLLLIQQVQSIVQQVQNQVASMGMTNLGQRISTPASRPALEVLSQTHGGPGPQTIIVSGTGFSRDRNTTLHIFRTPPGGGTTDSELAGQINDTPFQVGAANGERLTMMASDGTRDDNDLTLKLWSPALSLVAG